jgi:hypothetical protein
MAHYAFLDENNVVTEVITGVDETELIDGLSPEVWYGNFKGKKCVRTSYNGNIRKHFAGVGMTYDTTFDMFIPEQPFSNWKLNYETVTWVPPIEKPEDIDGFIWLWSQPNTQWVKQPYIKPE